MRYSKELPVLRILGANSMYDIVKFNTETDKNDHSIKIGITAGIGR